MQVLGRVVMRGFRPYRSVSGWIIVAALASALPMQRADAQGSIRIISQDSNYLSEVLSCTARFTCTGDGASDFTSSNFGFVPSFGATHAFELGGATASWIGEYTFLGTNESASDSLLLSGDTSSSGTYTGSVEFVFARGRSDSSVEVFFEVIGGTVTGSIEALITPSVTGLGHPSYFLTLKKQASQGPDEVLVDLRARCCGGASPACDSISDSDCGSASLAEPLSLEPGVYRLNFSEAVDLPPSGESQAGSYTLQSQWTLELGAETPCDLAWAAAESGEFGVASNWEPPAVPDDDAGCSNLIFDQAGGYEVTFDAGDAANSMRVLSGLPSFTGGTLTLSGADVSDGLSISNEGQLTLNAGTITASGIGVGVDAPNPSKGDIVPASILVKAGATLSSISSLDVARQSDTVGELALEGGESIATVTALGDAAFGVFGEAHVSSTSNVELSISGNLALGQFAGSATEMVMTGASDPEVQLASLFVGKTLTVASAGQADLLLSGLFLADITAMQVGALAGSDGIVNTNDGTLSVEEDLVVGGGGTGSFVLGGNVAFESENVILGADDGAVGTLLAVGESNQFKARQNVIVGDAGRGVLTLSDGLFLEAASLTVSSNPGSVTQTKDPSRFNADGREQPLDIAIAGEIIVGAAGSGEIETLEEAVVRASDLALGVLPGSTGVVFFLGGVPVDADLNDYDIAITDNISVGVAGLGRLATRDSGLLASRNMSLGIEPGGFGRFSAAGELNLTEVSETLTIGDAGRGELSIESAVVFAGACQLGAESDSQGLVQIQFGGELNITNDSETGEEGEFIPFGALQVGGKGTGVVELFDEDTLLSCSALTIGGENEFAGGTLHIAGGALSDVAAGANVGTSQGPGLVRIANGGAMQVGDTLLIGPNGLFIAGVGSNVASANTLVAGRLRVDLEVNIERPEKADAVPSKGDPGPAVFDGDLAIDAGGSLEVVAGAGNALIVTGAATLDGTLQITLQPGVAFTNDQLLNLIEFQGGVSGTFASVTFLNAPEGFDAEVEFSGGTLQLRIINGGIAIGEGEGGIDGEGQTADIHSADQNSDEGINLSELLRVIQFYNAFGLHCVTIEGETEDGYSPGIDETAEACLPHDSDFAPQDWTIILSELLQLIQLYNADGYDACEATESFCPRLP